MDLGSILGGGSGRDRCKVIRKEKGAGEVSSTTYIPI